MVFAQRFIWPVLHSSLVRSHLFTPHLPLASSFCTPAETGTPPLPSRLCSGQGGAPGTCPGCGSCSPQPRPALARRQEGALGLDPTAAPALLDPAPRRWGPQGAPRLTPLLLGTSDPAPLPSFLWGHAGSPRERERTRTQEQREAVAGGHSAARPEPQNR